MYLIKKIFIGWGCCGRAEWSSLKASDQDLFGGKYLSAFISFDGAKDDRTPQGHLWALSRLRRPSSTPPSDMHAAHEGSKELDEFSLGLAAANASAICSPAPRHDVRADGEGARIRGRGRVAPG